MARKTVVGKSIVEWLLAFLLILEINSVFYNAADFNFYISELACVCVAVLAILSIRSVSRKLLLEIVAYELLSGLYLLLSGVNPSEIMSFVVKFMLFLPIIIVIYVKNSNAALRIIIKISKITVFLAAASVVMYLLSYVLPPLGSISIFWGSDSRRGNYIFFFAGQYQEIAGRHVLRNTGIFSEAPMYGFVLVMALTTQLFFYEKPRKANIAILIVTIISTISVAAIAIMAVVLVLKLYLGRFTFANGSVRIRSNQRNRRLTRIIIVIFGGLLLAYVLYQLLNFKVNTGLSFLKRLDDYIAAFQVFISSPIFGIGYGNGDMLTQYMLDWRIQYSTVGYSNAIGIIMATMGIYGLLLYALAFFSGIRTSLKKKQYHYALQFAVLIVLLLVTVVPAQLYVLQYLAFGYALGLSYRQRRSKPSRSAVKRTYQISGQQIS